MTAPGLRAGTDPATTVRRRVEALLDLRRYQEALALLGPAIAAAPRSPILLCLRARALLAAGSPDEAVTAAREALAADPESEWAHRLHARALLRVPDAEGAIAAAREAVRVAPSEPLTQLALSEALRRGGRPDEAVVAAHRCVELAPAAGFAHRETARVLADLRDHVGADAAVRRALELNPVDAEALNLLGIVDLRRGDWRSALRHFTDAARSDPSMTVAMDNIAVAMRSATRSQVAAGSGIPRWMYRVPLLGAVLLMVMLSIVGVERSVRYVLLRRNLRGAVPEPAIQILDRRLRATAPTRWLVALGLLYAVAGIDILTWATHALAPLAVLLFIASAFLLTVALRRWRARRSSPA